jgi:protoporphyrinogen oxidase
MIAKPDRSPMPAEPIVILGTGMAALGAASRLADEGRPTVLVDANPYPGGHTATFDVGGGFLFDDGPHVSFTKDKAFADVLAANVDGRFQEIEARIDNYWHGARITHPVQMHLHGLPTDLVVDILRDFVAVHQGDPKEVRDYETWLRAAYGDTFAETFPLVYGRKYHTTTMDHLTTDWLGPRMYQPTFEEILRGALAPTDSAVHYVTSFRYPTDGGFQAYLRPWLERFDIRLGRRVVTIDPTERTVEFTDGSWLRYDRLISSVALPDLIPLVSATPPSVLAAARRLSFTSAVIVNLGVARDHISDAQITYVYDEDIIFPRLNFPYLLSPNVVPPGASSIQAELYFSDRYRPLTVAPEALIDVVVADLRRMGILRPDDRLLARDARLVRYANVIYDHDRAPAVATVHEFLSEIGVARCGRYGNWDHAWTDESFMSGQRAAEWSLANAARA